MKLIKTIHCRAVQALDAVGTSLRKGTDQALQEGPGALRTAPTLLRDSKAKKPMILAAREDFPGRESLLAALEEAGMDYVIWDDVSEELTVNDAENIRLYWLGARCDSFIAIGGPAVMNAAKAAAARAAHPGKNLPQLCGKNRLRRRLPPVLAIPTQMIPDAGEGRAVVGELLLEDVRLRPRLVILDPEFLETVDRDSALWALCRAAEAAAAQEKNEKALAVFGQLFAALEAVADGEEATEELFSAIHKGALAAGETAYACALGLAAEGLLSLPRGAFALTALPAVMDAWGKAGAEALGRLSAQVPPLKGEEPLPPAEDAAEEESAAEAQTVAAPRLDMLWRLRNLAFRLELPELSGNLNSDNIFLLSQAAEILANPHGRAPAVLDRKDLQAILEVL